MRAVLVTPIGLGVPGNGLSQRCALWADALAALGDMTRIVIPVVGPHDDDPNAIVVEPTADRWPNVPELAKGLTPDLGLGIGNDIFQDFGPIDVVVGVRSYLGDFCRGLRDALGSRLVIDLDDDDEAFFAARGELAEAERFRKLIDRLSKEADCLTSASGFGISESVPNGVAIPASIHKKYGRASVPTILFLGNMGYEPNREAAHWLIDEIHQEILRQIPDVSLVIAGPGSETLGPHGLGFVDDLEQLMDRTDVLIVPLREGSGTRIKILDAWAHGVPVVSTTIGAEGLGATDGEDVVLADQASTIAGAITRVLTDASLAEKLCKNGRARVAANFGRDRAVATATEILRATIRDGSDGDAPNQVVPKTIPNLYQTETDRGLIILNTATGDVHELDTTAAVIFSLIDGELATTQIAAEVQSIYELNEPPLGTVESAISDLVEIGVVTRVRLHDDRFRFE